MSLNEPKWSRGAKGAERGQEGDDVVVYPRTWRGRSSGGRADWRGLVLASIVFVAAFLVALGVWLAQR